MRNTVGALLLVVAALASGCDRKDSALASDEATPAGPVARTEEEKTIYALGAVLGRNAVKPLRLSESELAVLQEGIAATARGGEPEFPVEGYEPRFQELMQARAAAAAAEEKAKSRGFLDEAKKEEGAVASPSGLVYRTLNPGKGPSPGPTDVVKVHYHGTFTDGTVFDSSRKRDQPVEFALNQVIPCWTEGLQLMRVGETARLVCPSDIAYGDTGRPGIPPGATLIFEVELISIKGK